MRVLHKLLQNSVLGSDGRKLRSTVKRGGKRIKRKVLEKEKKKDNGRKGVERQGGRKMRGTKKKRPSEKERLQGRARRISFVAVGR